jgi:hypothetical protein
MVFETYKGCQILSDPYKLKMKQPNKWKAKYKVEGFDRTGIRLRHDISSEDQFATKKEAASYGLAEARKYVDSIAVSE